MVLNYAVIPDNIGSEYIKPGQKIPKNTEWQKQIIKK